MPGTATFDAGWPRLVFYPGLPPTRMCAINSFGSASNRFATPVHRVDHAQVGHRIAARSWQNQLHGLRPAFRRRMSHLCQTFSAS